MFQVPGGGGNFFICVEVLCTNKFSRQVSKVILKFLILFSRQVSKVILKFDMLPREEKKRPPAQKRDTMHHTGIPRCNNPPSVAVKVVVIQYLNAYRLREIDDSAAMLEPISAEKVSSRQSFGLSAKVRNGKMRRTGGARLPKI